MIVNTIIECDISILQYIIAIMHRIIWHITNNIVE